jgi:hypothetical protein
MEMRATVTTAESPPTGLPLADALALVDEAAERLWTPEGRAALAFLEGRGLTGATIRAARLGWSDKIRVPKRDGSGTWPLTGITVPWVDSGRLTRILVRRLGWFRGARDIEVFAESPGVYPSTTTIGPGAPLVIAGEEFDALLLAQELEGLASVVTLGAASSRLDGATYVAMLRCPRWFAAHEAGLAGDAAAAMWPARAVRARPPAPARDWGEVHAGGFNRIRYIWGGILRRPGTPWEDLAKARWGPGLTDPAPGIVADAPAGATTPEPKAEPAREEEQTDPAGPPVSEPARPAGLDGQGDSGRRSVIEGWPVEWRERWRRRADELQDSVLPRGLAELHAFCVVSDDLQEAELRAQFPGLPPHDGLSTEEVLAGIALACGSGPAPAGPSGTGPRDVRRGDKWLPWHFRGEES